MSHEDGGPLPLDIRARLAMLSSAEQEWIRGLGRPMDAAELERIVTTFEVPPARHVPRVQAEKAAEGG